MNEKNEIKWLRLMKIITEISSAEVILTLTTDMPSNIIACMKGHNGKLKIKYNAFECKTDSMVINASAHELAHYLIESKKHDDRFRKLWHELIEVIEKLYNT